MDDRTLRLRQHSVILVRRLEDIKRALRDNRVVEAFEIAEQLQSLSDSLDTL